MRRTLRGARAIVTGASSGIGRAIAEALLQQQARVLLCARRADRLEELRRRLSPPVDHLLVESGDVSDAAVRERLKDRAESSWGALDILINNAGIGAVGPFRQATSDRLQRIMDVNFMAPAELIRTCLPLLQRGRRPIIVNVSSVLGHRAVPNKSEYCASKFALHGLSDALRAELKADGIDVLLVSPSTTRTEFFDRVIDRQAAPRTQTDRAMSAQTVASKTLRAIKRGQHEIILSAGGKGLVWLDRLFPTLADHLVARYG